MQILKPRRDLPQKNMKVFEEYISCLKSKNFRGGEFLRSAHKISCRIGLPVPTTMR